MGNQAPDEARAEDSAPALNRDILDSLTDLVKRAGTVSHSIAAGFGVAPHDLLALFKLEGGLAMKELAQRMGCDASFVTAVADTLEKRGFIRRAPGQRDRRIKHLLLTPEGIAAKERMMAQLAANMPWCYALDEDERRCLLLLLRKMLDTPQPAGAGRTGAGHGDASPASEADSEAASDGGPGGTASGPGQPQVPGTAGHGGAAGT